MLLEFTGIHIYINYCHHASSHRITCHHFAARTVCHQKPAANRPSRITASPLVVRIRIMCVNFSDDPTTVFLN